MQPYDVVKGFEAELCRYTGAPFAVTTTSCTMALLLAVAWHLRDPAATVKDGARLTPRPMLEVLFPEIEIPKRTYIGVPMSIIHAGGRPTFRDEDWTGGYQLKPLPVWDFARRFTSGMFLLRHQMLCVSFHWAKTLGIQQGGAILHDMPEADAWLRRARFDGRTEGKLPQDDVITHLGFHCYMDPETAAAGLVRMRLLPKHNADLPNDPYANLAEMDIFK